jgi:hypothetical protein
MTARCGTDQPLRDAEVSAASTHVNSDPAADLPEASPSVVKLIRSPTISTRCADALPGTPRNPATTTVHYTHPHARMSPPPERPRPAHHHNAPRQRTDPNRRRCRRGPIRNSDPGSQGSCAPLRASLAGYASGRIGTYSPTRLSAPRMTPVAHPQVTARGERLALQQKSGTAGHAGARSAGSHLSGSGGSKPSEPLCERCAKCSSPDRGLVRRETAGHDAGSRDGDSNPGPAHYEQFQPERCAHRHCRLRGTASRGAASAELSAELARPATTTRSMVVDRPVADLTSRTWSRPIERCRSRGARKRCGATA